uniref:Immunoglobulin V-set domain-containing protein n=1 Tax=Hippocampus comes TaxID=109280 RepID=A0A3Q3D249_HIPCM
MLKLLFSHPSGTSGELVAVTTEMLASKGSRVTVSYVYADKAISGDDFLWYKQLPGQAPHFLLSHLGNGKPLKVKPGMSVSIASDRERVHLYMEEVSLEHSAVYYCAVRPTRLQRQGTREHREYTNEISQAQ